MSIILHNHGNYKELLTFKRATVLYDLTFHFCGRYLSKGDRTVDQMIQAARSGKQNIAEGVAASSTNAETEMKLINVAKASLKELLTDYEDYLRTRKLRLWAQKGEEANWLCEFAKSHDDSAPYLKIAEKKNDEVVANMAIVLLRLEDYLLFKQLKALEEAYKAGGDMHTRVKEAEKDAKEARRSAAFKAVGEIGKRCPKCNKVLDDGYEGGKRIWRCSGCGHKEPLDLEEFLRIKEERHRAGWRVKAIFGY